MFLVKIRRMEIEDSRIRDHACALVRAACAVSLVQPFLSTALAVG
jgi:hypothetical protein